MIVICLLILTLMKTGIGLLLLSPLTPRRQYEGHNTPLGDPTDQGRQVHGQYDCQGEYYALNTASEVFLIFTTQLVYSCLCNCYIHVYAIVLIS